jgi:hypothetical protein
LALQTLGIILSLSIFSLATDPKEKETSVKVTHKFYYFVAVSEQNETNTLFATHNFQTSFNEN